ncbi:hypothetical protein [Pseudomonas sp. SDO558_S425]
MHHRFTVSPVIVYQFIYQNALTGNFQMVNLPQTGNEHRRPAAKAAPIFSDTPCRITTGPDSKAAMNRPKRFRGLATDPGVQRKAPRTVIQRENKPKGPWLEEQLIQASDRRQ